MNEVSVVSIGGFGHWPSVFREFSELPNVKLAGLAPAYQGEDISRLQSHVFAEQAKVFDDYNVMLDEIKPDVAIVSTRLDIIPQTIIAAANRKCNIIAEKPLALDRQTLADVERAVNKNNVKLTAMLSMRSRPEFIAARDIYQSRTIGEAAVINVRKSYKYGDRPEWFGDKSKYGSTIGWVGIHALDIANFITSLEFANVAAMTGNFAHSQRPDCDDSCTMILTLSNGAHLSVSLDLFRPESADTHGDDWIRIAGTKGILEARTSAGTCQILTDTETPATVSLPQPGCIYKDFIAAISGREDVDVYQKQSFLLTHACLCAQQSARTHSFVDIQNSI